MFALNNGVYPRSITLLDSWILIDMKDKIVAMKRMKTNLSLPCVFQWIRQFAKKRHTIEKIVWKKTICSIQM